MAALVEPESIAALLSAVAREHGHHVEAWQDAWDNVWARATAAWPDLDVVPTQFARRVLGSLPAGASPTVLAALHADELLLAHAALAGDEAALRSFERLYVDELRAIARTIDFGSADEVVQRLRDAMLVGPKAKLRDYAGTGSLRRWLKIAAKRKAIDFQRSVGRRREDGIAAGGDAMVADADPELSYIKAHYREQFRAAFGDAMKALDSRSRAMLRLHMVHRLSIDEIAPMHNVHRATVARWIAKTRTDLAELTRRELGRRIGVESGEVDSVIHMIASRLDVTVTRHLESISELPGSDSNDEPSS